MNYELELLKLQASDSQALASGDAALAAARAAISKQVCGASTRH
jgi:hypothetical protein